MTGVKLFEGFGERDAFGATAVEVDKHHDGKRQANEDGEKPESLVAQLAAYSGMFT